MDSLQSICIRVPAHPNPPNVQKKLLVHRQVRISPCIRHIVFRAIAFTPTAPAVLFGGVNTKMAQY